ncbi:sulfite exporter TauE/SafE family protein [Inmirania thermothiophila]|uniref:Probable membrane transporter protein n=1 Tax=Inmirania thermothiophila TaxID=1750597 RepID=A0A3N1YAW3_9GAMM|nr:sulfite exporter TauE/SafE family protein [Inmirania thermothiophila]ROR34527.1 hypothetical protein EDC57_0425 [Inmirania thermothiophila]
MTALALLAYLAAGALAGVLAGLLGVGGGIVIVPALLVLLEAQGVAPELSMHMAVGTSLATILLTSLSSVRAHHRRGALRRELVAAMAPAIAAGALAGAGLADALAGAVLRRIFGAFLLLVAAQLALELVPAGRRQVPGRGVLAAAGGVIGAVSALLGIGGGSLTVPFLVWRNVPVHEAVATSAACGLPIAAAGAAGFVWGGWGETGLPPWSLGYVHLPALAGIALASVPAAPVGAALAHRWPAARLRRIFAAFLVVVGLRMLLGGG